MACQNQQNNLCAKRGVRQVLANEQSCQSLHSLHTQYGTVVDEGSVQKIKLVSLRSCAGLFR